MEILWVGAAGKMEEELVRREGIPFESIPAAGLHGVGLKNLPANALKIAQGVLASRKLIRKFNPDVMFFTGGYVAVPVALAGLAIPKVLYVPDIEPALALKLLTRFASVVTVTTEESTAYFPANKEVIVTGYPTRQGLKRWDRTDALAHFGLSPDEPVLLVFGGSLGARSINYALMGALPNLLSKMQIIHICGKLDFKDVESFRQTLPANLSKKYHIFEYLHEDMGAAFSAADLVVSRAGASILGEFPMFGLPAILVPYPHAWQYQKTNAQYLVKHGAAVLLTDQDLQTELEHAVLKLMGDQAARDAMANAMRRLYKPDAAVKIAALIYRYGSQLSRKDAKYG